MTADGRTALIDAAERLMAEQGISAVSLRSVGVAAGHRNHSAAQFHFGTREGLLQAIVVDRMGPINRRRAAMLDAVDPGDPDELAALAAALVRPLAEATLDRPGSCYARFLAASYADPRWSEAVAATVEGQGFATWRQRTLAALAHLPTELARDRVDRVTVEAICAIARWEQRPRPARRQAALLADLEATVLAALSAPAAPGAPA